MIRTLLTQICHFYILMKVTNAFITVLLVYESLLETALRLLEGRQDAIEPLMSNESIDSDSLKSLSRATAAFLW